jgi:hypothetical protein
VLIGARVGVENGAGNLVRGHRGMAAAGGSAPASWAAGLVNVRPGELQQGREVAKGSSDSEGVNWTWELVKGSGHGMVAAWRLGSGVPGVEKENDLGHRTCIRVMGLLNTPRHTRLDEHAAKQCDGAWRPRGGHGWQRMGVAACVDGFLRMDKGEGAAKGTHERRRTTEGHGHRGGACGAQSARVC